MNIQIWADLSIEEQEAVLQRPAVSDNARIKSTVQEIRQQVLSQGDTALIELTKKLDGIELNSLKISSEQMTAAKNRLPEETKTALHQAYHNIEQFHRAQLPQPLRVETQAGVVCESIARPIENVGLYIPGGSAPLPSTVLMLGIPTQLAKCQNVVLCSPPPIADEILYAASLCEITEIHPIGGAQAITAMAYGTASVAKVDKIFGPGNAFVTEAKQQISQDPQGAAIDMPAGPSEILVIADASANPEFIAADLLSQAEHGIDSQAILLTPSLTLAKAVEKSIVSQLVALPRQEIARQALEYGQLVVTEGLDACFALSNRYGPEHLIVQTDDPRSHLPQLHHAGSIFLGAWSPESVGDYASGTNHVLPTYGHTRSYSSLGMADFFKRMTVQELTPKGLQQLAPTVLTLAKAEQLMAHHNAVSVRLAVLEAE